MGGLFDMNSEERFPRGALLPDWSGAKPPEHIAHAGEHVSVEPMREEHLAPLYETLRESPEHDWFYMPCGPFATLEAFRAWACPRIPAADRIMFTIFCRKTGAALGFLSYMRIKPETGSIEIGYVQFGTKLQRTTGATEAIFLLVRHVFELGYRRMEWKCDALNARSRRAATRLGFTFEGVFRQAVVVKGRNRDTAWFAITDQDWQKLEGIYEKWFERLRSGEDHVSLSKLTERISG